MFRSQWSVVLGLLLVAAGWSQPAQAQIINAIPRDVFNPSPDVNLPELLPNIIRPQDTATIIFDGLLDPSGGSDPSRLTAAAQSILNHHLIAQQQVELTIRFLIANRAEIVAGRNEQFNRVFGNSSQKKKVAILAPVPLPGMFNIGAPTTTQGQAQQAGPLVLQSRPQTGGGANQQQSGSVANQILRGEFLFVDLTRNMQTAQQQQQQAAQVSRFPSLLSSGLVVRVAQVVTPNQGGTQTNTQQSQNADVYLDPSDANLLTTVMGNRSNLTVWRVVRFEEQSDPTIYERVLATYTAIRDSLAGFDPARPQAGQRTIQYNRRFSPIADVRDGSVLTRGQYAAGVAAYTPLNAVVSQFIPGRVADRLVRQAGLSLSDSHYHLDRLDDISAGNLTRDYRNQPLTPLLWTEDNELPLQFDQNSLVPGATAENRAYFHDRQTIFAGVQQLLPGVVDQYVGRAFLEEQILHAGDFFARDGLVVASATALATGVRDARIPERGNPVPPVGGAIGVPALPVTETGFIPESGTPIPQATLRRWQMILESFAEWGVNLASTDVQGRLNIAAIGLMNIAGAGATPDIRAADAGNYALFADLIRGSGGGAIDFSRVEPLGKRASAGFNPVVPSN